MKIKYLIIWGILFFALIGCTKKTEVYKGNGYVVKYEYFQDGQLKSKTNFLGDKKWGSRKVYYRQWRIRSKEFYIDDKKEGK